MDKVRAALNYVGKKLKSAHPLISQEFETDGASLFVTRYGKLVDVSEQGQTYLREVVAAHLERLERDEQGVFRLYPFTTPELNAQNPRSVYIDPRVSFGRMVLAAAGVPTSAVVERYRAGESIAHLAEDYGCKGLDVEEAIRCELRPFDTAA